MTEGDIVYIVRSYNANEEDSEIHGVFSTLAKAEAARAEIKETICTTGAATEARVVDERA